MPLKHYFSNYAFLFLAFTVLIGLTSCGSYQYVGADNDGIYGTSETRERVEPTNQTVVNDNNKAEGNSYYQNYFKEKSLEYENLNDEIFTDIETYEGEYAVENDTTQVEYRGYAGWGENSQDVTINVYSGFNNTWWYGPRWGWNNWGWNNWGWNYGWRWNNWGWNDPFFWNNGWGWNNWAWGYNAWCLPNYGYAGAYNYGYRGRGLAYNASRRGALLNRNSRLASRRSASNSRSTLSRSTTRRGAAISRNTSRSPRSVTRSSSRNNNRSFSGSNSRSNNRSFSRSNSPRSSRSSGSFSRSSSSRSSGGFSRGSSSRRGRG